MQGGVQQAKALRWQTMKSECNHHYKLPPLFKKPEPGSGTLNIITCMDSCEPGASLTLETVSFEGSNIRQVWVRCLCGTKSRRSTDNLLTCFFTLRSSNIHVIQ